MGLYGKMETTIEIRASAEKFYELFKGKVYHIPSISPDGIKSVDLHEGEWHSHGAVKQWTYNLGETSLTVKERVEIDDGNKLLKFTVLGGDILQEFKFFKSSLQAIEKEDGTHGSFVKWEIEYEKLSEDVKDPDGYVDLGNKITKDIDAYLCTV